MASIALKRLGHNVRIMERSPTPLLHDQGAGIVMGGDTQDFLSLYDRFKTPNYVRSAQRLYLDHAGQIIHRESKPQQMTSWDLIYNIARANFDDLESGYTKAKGEEYVNPGGRQPTSTDLRSRELKNRMIALKSPSSAPSPAKKRVKQTSASPTLSS
jgi:hypothetical protein